MPLLFKKTQESSGILGTQSLETESTDIKKIRSRRNMKQHATLILSIVITAFLLVLIGGVTASLMSSNISQEEPRTALTTSSAPDAAPTTSSSTPVEPEPGITADRSALIALDAAVGARLLYDPELVNFEGSTAYEVPLDQGMVYVDAQTGDVLANQTSTHTITTSSTNGQISRAQAIEIARNHAGGGTVEEAELEREHGTLTYEVEFTDGSEVYVDATGGQVLYAELSRSRSHDNEYENDEEDEDHDEYEYDEDEEHDDD
jgi:uncharacterized membrane protein YkoI